MSLRKYPFVEGEYYHIYSRGNSKQKIFLDDEDYEHFTKCLFVFNSYKTIKFRDDIIDAKINAFDFERGETLVSIGAWCLMPNHFHLYLTMNKNSTFWDEYKKNKISEFMRKVLTAYTKYFNAKYKRTGGLFESKFKSMYVSSEIQAKYLFSYIHLNCIKLIQKDWKEKGIKDIKKSLEFLDNYKWSSYSDYIGVKRPENKILQKDDFPKYFFNTKDFKKEILEWLNYNNDKKIAI